MRLQSETIVALILLVAGALATIIIYNIIYPNLNIINPSGQEISRSLKLNFQLLDYYIANNTLYAYVKPSEPVNYSQIFAILNNRLVNVYPYNSNGSIVNPYNNGLLIVVANLSQIPPDQNGNYELEVGLENDIVGIFTIKYISNTLINYFQPPIIFNISTYISNSTSNTSSSTSGSSSSSSSPPNSTSSTSACQSSYLPLILYNTQNISTPSPFQQDIAICNGSINIGSGFSYVNNATLFNQINSNGSNVYFATTNNSTPNIYSWYEGQLINGSTYCDVWWVNLSNGIPANSNVTIYMYIGNSSCNYYSQYYPYVGTNEQVIGTMQYDNGNYTFIAYGYFNNTFDGWNGYVYQGSWSPTATQYGIEMLNGALTGEGTYILPPNNWNIPEIPLIVEEAWYDGANAGANIISLFGNATNQVNAYNVGNVGEQYASVPNSSTFGEIYSSNGYIYLESSVTNQVLNSTYSSSLSNNGGIAIYYSYLIVNLTYAEVGWYWYSHNGYTGEFAPLTLLDTYTYNVYNSNNINNNISAYTYSNLNYNSFQYSTLEISAGSGVGTYIYVEWVIARAYPPNGVMPSIYIG
jgi:hypothetical protein